MSLSPSKSNQSDIFDRESSLNKIHNLPQESLYLWNTWNKEKSPRDVVPPHTPNSEFNFEGQQPYFPKTFPELDGLAVPFVRDRGVKFCIDKLGEYFGCEHYRFNMLQFWFLDILTDCLWTAQDDFQLPVLEQKIVLSWVLYLVDLIRDPKINISRRRFFTVFKEAMLVASEVVDEGCDSVPTPEKLFSFVDEEEEPESWASSTEQQSDASSLEINCADFDNVSCIELQEKTEKRRYVLPHETCKCSKYDLSSIDSVEESNSSVQKSTENVNGSIDKEQIEEVFKNDKFYQPDLHIPARFLPLVTDVEAANNSEENQSEAEYEHKRIMCKMTDSTVEEDEGDLQVSDQYHVYEVSDEFLIRRSSDISASSRSTADTTKTDTTKSEDNKQRIPNESKQSLATISSFNKDLLEKYNNKKILKGLAFRNLWEQRLQDMKDPKRGWVPTLDDIEATTNKESMTEVTKQELTSEDDENTDDEEWADIMLKMKQKPIDKDENKLIVNFGVLRVIINFVFKYFYESFQFSLIKLAFQAAPETIIQKLNQDWKIPKRTKGELQKPKPEKLHKEKAPKKETPRKEKPKKEKADKKKGKEAKKKPEKKKDKEKDKKSSDKKKMLTPEEKAELERKRLEEERIKEELRRIEEQKRYMFPLGDAASDKLFQRIFEDWVRVDWKTGKLGKGKGKDDGKGKDKDDDKAKGKDDGKGKKKK